LSRSIISPFVASKRAGIPKPILEFVEEMSPSDTVLDIGAGVGHKTVLLEERVAGSVYACDINPRFVEELRKIVDGRAFWCDVSEQHGIPVPDSEFSKILMWNVAMFIPPERVDEAIEEIKRVAKDGAEALLGFYILSRSTCEKLGLDPRWCSYRGLREASLEFCERLGEVQEFRCSGKYCWCRVKVVK